MQTLLLASMLASLQVVTTTQDPAAIIQAIGGDRVDVTTLAKGYQDPHYIAAKPSYMLALNKADLLVHIGMDLEIGYLPNLIQGARNKHIRDGQAGNLNLATHVTRIGATDVVDRARGDLHPVGNPHYWLDPDNARAMAKAIAVRLAELDPEGKAAYAAGLATFEETLTTKEAQWERSLAQLEGKPIVTYHTSWDYFVRRYKLDVVGHIEPKPGVPPSPKHTTELIREIRAKNVKIILMENFYDARVPKLIAKKSEAKVVIVPNSVGGDKGINTYFDLMDAIIAALVEASQG